MSIDIVPLKQADELYLLRIERDEIYAYFDIPNSTQNTLKIIYASQKYENQVNSILFTNLIYFLLSSLVLFGLSIFYSLYALKPLKEALHLLEEFLKDIIHDLNTPVSSILLNLRILKQKDSQEAKKRIELSAKSIGSLYKNLEASIKDSPLHITTIDIKELLEEKIEYFQSLYPDICFELLIKTDKLHSSYDELSRILDNLISNACKYNKENGRVKIEVSQNRIIIQDSGFGIKDTKKVFNRFYKESERGLGLGLDIVKKLCQKLDIEIEITSELGVGSSVELTLR